MRSEKRYHVSEQAKNKPLVIENISFKGKVLVAEDVLTNQMLIKRMLNKLKLEPKIVEDGQKAVDLASSESFDLIFMDIQMPNMNGLEATKLLRQKGNLTPIVALTANALKGDDKKCIKAGCSDYMSKPIKRKRLLEVLEKYLERERDNMNKKINKTKKQIDELCELFTPENSDIKSTVPVSNDGYITDVIDFKDLENRGMDEEIIKEMIPLFIADSRVQLEDLATAIKKKNSKQVRSLAHSIKGASANIGAIKISEAALKIEKKDLNKDLAGAKKLLKLICTEFKRLESIVSDPGWIDVVKASVDSKSA
ncbi:MAG: response regulator [Planctomycetota bacterium]